MSEKPFSEIIRAKIIRSRFGAIFFTSSFPEYNEDYVNRLLSLFEREGLLSRMARGIYVKVKKTRFGLVYPSVKDVAESIAKRDGSEILPTGAMAENMLGLSSQVPMNPGFLTNGSTRKLKIGNRTLTFQKGAQRYFAYCNKTLAIIVLAMKSIGENNITPEIEQKILLIWRQSKASGYLTHDLALTPAWIRRILTQK